MPGLHLGAVDAVYAGGNVDQTVTGIKTFSSDVGIGTAAVPSARLHVAGINVSAAGGGGIVRIESTTAWAEDIGPSLAFYGSTLVSANRPLGEIAIRKEGAVGNERAYFQVVVNGTNGYIERLRVSSRGTLTIGTANESDLLTGTAKLRLEDGTFIVTMGGNAQAVAFSNGTVTGLLIPHPTEGAVFGSFTVSPVTIRTSNVGRITIGATGSVTFNAAGPHAIGGAVAAESGLIIQGTPVLADTGLGYFAGVRIQQALAAQAPGLNIHGLYVFPSITEYSSGNHPLLTSLFVATPAIVAGAATVTDAVTLCIQGAPTATVSGNNYALWIQAGAVRIDSSLGIGLGAHAGNYAVQVAGPTRGTVALGITPSTFAANDILIYFSPAVTVTGSAYFINGAISATTGAAAIFANSNAVASGANAFVQASTGGASGGDPFVSLVVSGVTNWTVGVDNSDGDAFKITTSGNPSAGSEWIKITTAGITTLSGQLNTLSTVAFDAPATVSNAIVLIANTARTIGGEAAQLKTGAVTFTITAGFARQRFTWLDQPTLTAGSALTVVDAATLYVAGAPVAAGSAVITTAYALWVAAGGTRLGGGIVGSTNGYDGGELHFATVVGSGNPQYALATLDTATPSLMFDHRGAGNTGNWYWRNGTGAASQRMTLSGTGDLTLAGEIIPTNQVNVVSPTSPNRTVRITVSGSVLYFHCKTTND